MFKGQKGNPVLFPKSFEKKLLSIEGDSGAKKMLENANYDYSKMRSMYG